MKKKFLIGAGVLVGLVLLGVLAGFLLPAKRTVERSVVMNAEPEAIHPWVANLKKWPEWTAWNKERYPDMAYTYEGPDMGVGAISTWTAKDGSGRLEITDANPTTGIRYKLWFTPKGEEEGTEPTRGGLSYEPTENGTKVTWSFEFNAGNNPIARWFGFMLDSMVGPDFERGLATLKEKAETGT